MHNTVCIGIEFFWCGRGVDDTNGSLVHSQDNCSVDIVNVYYHNSQWNTITKRKRFVKPSIIEHVLPCVMWNNVKIKYTYIHTYIALVYVIWSCFYLTQFNPRLNVQRHKIRQYPLVRRRLLQIGGFRSLQRGPWELQRFGRVNIDGYSDSGVFWVLRPGVCVHFGVIGQVGCVFVRSGPPRVDFGPKIDTRMSAIGVLGKDRTRV